MADAKTLGTPSPEEVLRRVIESRLAQVNTCLPGKIETYDAATKTATVQPLLRRQFRDGEIVDLPIVTNVPVVWPTSAAGQAIISLPIKNGDGCLLLFSQRSLDNWLSVGGTADPKFPHKHDLSDGIAIPGLESFASPVPAHPDDVLIQLGSMQVRLQPGGKVAIGSGGVELLAQISDSLAEVASAINQVAAITVGAAPGPPQPIANAAAFPPIAAKVQAIKSQLDLIKGSL